MTMQVSKGEFDRRVKLLEQQVKDSSNGLISRLQAETEAFIEKLRNTELDIENLKNEVTGTETNLDNLVTSFNNYKANTLRVNDVFDANGQFDGSKIKPLSIDTAAISVGQRSQQLTLTGVNFTVNDYSSGNGKLIWTSGTMFHYGFEAEDGEPKLYTIYVQNSTGEYPFQNGNAHYIYAVFKRDTKTETTYNNIGTISKDYFDNCDSGVLFLDSAGTTSATTYNSETTYYLKQTETISNAISGDNIAYILVTTSKISVEGNIIDGQGTFNPTDIPGANYSANQKLFYIQLGYVSGTLTGSNGYNYRKVDMTYGSTTINGRLITTGRIEGNNVAVDLDTGEISGVVSYGLTTTQLGSALNTIYGTATDAKNAFDNLEVGGRNLVLGTATPMASGGVLRTYNMSPAFSAVTGEEFMVSFDMVLTGTVTFSVNDPIFIIENNMYWFILSSGTYTAGTHHISVKKTAPNNYTSSALFYRFFNTSAYQNLITLKNVKLEKGNKATDWSPAPEDMEEGGWVTKTQTIYCALNGSNRPNAPSAPSSVVTTEGGTSSDQYGMWYKKPPLGSNCKWYFKCDQTWKEKNNSKENIQNSQVIYDEALTTNIVALKGETAIEGGLVLTTKIRCGNENATAGIMGVPLSDYAFWAGQQEPVINGVTAPVWIKRNGDARFQNLYFTNSVITNKSTLANSEFGIHTDALPSALNINFQKSFSSSGKTLEMQPTSIQWILKLEEFGSYTWAQVNSGYLRVKISFDYEMTLSNVGSTGNVAFYFYDGVEKQNIGSASFTTGDSRTTLDSITANNLIMTHMSNSNYYYGLIGVIEQTGGSATPFGGLSMRINNVKIDLYSSMPNMNKGFHIHPNGIVLYVNESHYFMLFSNGSELKCYNTLGI